MFYLDMHENWMFKARWHLGVVRKHSTCVFLCHGLTSQLFFTYENIELLISVMHLLGKSKRLSVELQHIPKMYNICISQHPTQSQLIMPMLEKDP